MTTALDPATGSRAPAGRDPGSGLGKNEPPELDDRLRRRLHLFTVSVALIVLTFVQAPGKIVPDTKADLNIDPIGFLVRAWHLWEPLGDSGQLQNQAYGYFLPMGPFFALGHVLGLPAWIVQRAWWSLVFWVAFYGMYRLCRAFGVGTHSLQIIAALTFALSPRMITEMGGVSIEIWPMAMAPWVLLPLVKVRPGGEPIAAARSGLALALCGGVNAVAVGAVLPLPVWWLITREKGPVRRRLTQWWAGAAAMGIFWWLAPLLLLGRYSPPFLEWVESSYVSTSKASLPSAFRGTTQWVSWIRLPEPYWLAGWSVITSPAGILLSWLMIVIAVLGMLRRDMPHRRFIIGLSIAGLLLMTMGHTGPLTGPWAQPVQTFLDNAGSALRNTSKFDVVFRVPITLALAHAMTRVRLPAFTLPGLPLVPGGPRLLRFVVACALVGNAAPALVGQLPAAGSYTGVPSYWGQAAAWLQQHNDGGRTLIVPGSSFDTSTWGDPHDEAFQALARTPWATRSSVPLSSGGNIRMLNTIEEQLETGRGSAGLTEYLKRAGISKILLRADLARQFTAGSPPLPIVVRSAIDSTPGLTYAASFGPMLHGSNDAVQVSDDGLDVSMPAIQIWDLDGGAGLADVYPASSAIKVQGGPESLLALDEAGKLGNRATVLSGDPDATAPSLQNVTSADTDTMQRREANIAQVRDNYSGPMTADQPYVNLRKEHDWVPFPAPEVVAQYEGISGVDASSSTGTTSGPWYAFDTDDNTAWTSSAFAEGQWIQVTFPRATQLATHLSIVSNAGGADISQVEITTDAGSVRSTLGRTSTPDPQEVAVPSGATRSLRLTVTKVYPGTELRSVAINSITIPGITPARPLLLPVSKGSSAPDLISLQNQRDGTDSCMFENGDAICSTRLQTLSEDTDLDRIVPLSAGGQYTATGTARLRARSATSDGLLAPTGKAMTATASSRRTFEPAQRPQAAVDEDAGTAWVADPGDAVPTLTVRWPARRTVGKLRWYMDPTLSASVPTQLTITAGGRTTKVTPDQDGWAAFPSVTTTKIVIEVTGTSHLQSYDRATGFFSTMPVGVSELQVPGANDLRQAYAPAKAVTIPCGKGPALSVNGTTIQTSVTGTADDVLRRLPMTMTPCTTLPALKAGQNRITATASSLFTPQSLLLDNGTSGSAPAAQTQVEVQQKNQEHRTVAVNASAKDQILNVHENLNAGWRAELGGHTLQPVRVDGWQQGWVIPAGQGGTVRLTFTPGSGYRLALVAGLLMVAALAGFALPQRGRRRSLTRRSRHAAVVAIPEATTGGRWIGALGLASTVAVGGVFAAGAIVAVLIAVRQRLQMRYILAGTAAIAGYAAAFSINSGESGILAITAIAASLVVLACMAIRLDAAVGGLLGRLSRPGGTAR